MKKLLLSILTLASITAYGQADFIRTKPVGSSTANMTTFNKQTIVDANLRAGLTLFVPKGATPTLNNAKDSVGAVFFKINPSSDTSFYVYHGNSTWVRYAKFTDIQDALANYTPLPNIGVTGNGLTVDGDSIIVASGTYRVNGTIYSQSGRIIANIPYSPSGTSRWLTFIGTEAGIVDTLGGTADSIAVYPTVGANEADLGSVLVGDGVIGQPTTPTELITGGVITSVPTVGFNAGSNITAAQWITNAFYQSQAPTSSLSGITTLEKRPSGTTDIILTWVIGRLASTQPISSVVVGGVSQTFVQPSAPGSRSGLQTVSVPNNTNTTYYNTVTTVDSKIATSSSTVTWFDRRFYGRSASATPDETIIEASAGGASALSNSRAGTFIITASGSNYPYLAYPVIYGALTSIKDVNNFEVLSSFNQTTVSITNSFGLSISYYVYTLNSATASNYQITTL